MKVGVIGLGFPHTADEPLSFNAELDFLPLVEAANRVAADMQAKGVETIIVSMHEGGCPYVLRPYVLRQGAREVLSGSEGARWCCRLGGAAAGSWGVRWCQAAAAVGAFWIVGGE